MHLAFFDFPHLLDSLKPFTLTRPIAQIRVGIWCIEEKWKNHLSQQIPVEKMVYITEPYLQEKFPFGCGDDNLLINAAVCPDPQLVEAVSNLKQGDVLRHNEHFIAIRLSGENLKKFKDQREESRFAHFGSVLDKMINEYQPVSYHPDVVIIRHKWEIFQHNAGQISADFAWIQNHQTSNSIQDPHTIIYNPENVFVEEGASVKAAIINAEDGPVYIGKNATIHESAVIKGPFAMLEGAHINMGSKIREATTVGPFCKVGGEVKNVVFFANSNKGHEGFLGNSVIGEWCNFGADTNSSNLKNNYKPVRLWHYGYKSYEDTDILFCGLMMGDHSKCGINTMFNTGTVVGVSANLFGTDYLPKFIPSFTWGGAQYREIYRFPKAIEVARAVVGRRGIDLPEADEHILKHIFDYRDQEL